MRGYAGTVCTFVLLFLHSQPGRAEAVATPAPLRPIAASQPKPALRTWTDVSGNRHAQAALLKVSGQTLLLRKANGKLARIKLDQLSQADRQYVAQNRPAVAESNGLLSDRPILSEALSTFMPNLEPLANKLTTPSAKEDESADDDPPADLVYVRISREFLNDYIARPYQQQSTIRDCILGTNLFGNAHTSTVSHLVLKDSPNQAVGDVMFAGTIHSQTVGYNGPVILHNSSQTQFAARKPLAFGVNGLTVSPARSAARTQTTTNFIETTLPGLRGRIAERVAWRRVGESRAESDAIAARHAEARIDRALDTRVDGYIAQLKKAMTAQLPSLAYQGDRQPPQIRMGSTTDHVFVVMQRPEATADQRQLVPPPVAGNPGIVAQVHHTVVRQAMTDAKFQTAIAPVLATLFGNRVAPVNLPAGQHGLAAGRYEVRWSADGQWLTVNVNRRNTPPAGAEVTAQATIP